MDASNVAETKECTFQWKIKNVSSCWWLAEGRKLQSPTFIADALIGTKWSLWLYLMGFNDKNYIGLYLGREEDCSGPDLIDVNYQLAFLGKDGSIMEELTSKRLFKKNSRWGSKEFESRERVFVTEREAFLPGDTLTVQCTLQKTDATLVNSKYLYGRTILNVNQKYFIWRIDKFSTTQKPDLRNNIKDALFDFDLVLNEDSDKLDMDMISFDDGVKHISFNISVINSEGKKENFGIKNYFVCDLKKGILSPVMSFHEKLIESKSQYLPNDTLSLDFEFSFSTVENFGCGKNSAKLENDAVRKNECCIEEISQKMNILTDDLKCMFKDGIFSDTELRTSTKSFPVHKNILSARSPVFRRMYSTDMTEVNSGHVFIADFEDDIVHRMLLYIYTDTLEDLQFESVSELYKIADKYEILSLKSKCFSFLKDNL